MSSITSDPYDGNDLGDCDCYDGDDYGGQHYNDYNEYQQYNEDCDYGYDNESNRDRYNDGYGEPYEEPDEEQYSHREGYEGVSCEPPNAEYGDLSCEPHRDNYGDNSYEHYDEEYSYNSYESHRSDYYDDSYGNQDVEYYSGYQDRVKEDSSNNDYYSTSSCVEYSDKSSHRGLERDKYTTTSYGRINEPSVSYGGGTSMRSSGVRPSAGVVVRV